MKPLSILAISGSTKNESTSLHLIKHLSRLYSDIDWVVYDKIADLPHFNPDLSQENVPSPVLALREMIKAVDAVLVVTPEYVFSLPGSLKNGLEWNVSTVLLSGKPMGAIVAAASGEKAFTSLKLILRTIEAILPDESTLLIPGAKGKIDGAGFKDPGLIQQVKHLMQSLLNTIANAD